MNRFRSFAMAFLFFTSLSWIQARAADDLTGKWTGKSSNIDLVLEMKADNSASLTMKKDGQSKTVAATYKDGVITFKDDSPKPKTAKYALKEGKLAVKAEGEPELIFERVKAIAANGKFTPPKLGDGEQTWDVSALEKKFKIVKCTFVDERIVFLLESNQDVNSFYVNDYTFKVSFYDSDDVKFLNSIVSYEPAQVKKGERVRMTVSGIVDKTIRSKAVKIVVVEP